MPNQYRPHLYVARSEKELNEFEKDVKRGGKTRLSGAYGGRVYILRAEADNPQDRARVKRVNLLRRKRAMEMIKKHKKRTTVTGMAEVTG